LIISTPGGVFYYSVDRQSTANTAPEIVGGILSHHRIPTFILSAILNSPALVAAACEIGRIDF